MLAAHVSRAAPRVLVLDLVLLAVATGAYSIDVGRATDPRLTEADQAL